MPDATLTTADPVQPADYASGARDFTHRALPL
jgi:hypothetical protein